MDRKAKTVSQEAQTNQSEGLDVLPQFAFTAKAKPVTQEQYDAMRAYFAERRQHAVTPSESGD